MLCYVTQILANLVVKSCSMCKFCLVGNINKCGWNRLAIRGEEEASKIKLFDIGYLLIVELNETTDKFLLVFITALPIQNSYIFL